MPSVHIHCHLGRGIALAAAVIGLAAGPAAAASFSPVARGLSLASSEYVCGNPGEATSRDNMHHGGDMAFWGNTAVVNCGADDGNLTNDGFAIVNITNRAAPKVLGRFPCVAAASDIQIWGNYVFTVTDTNNDDLTFPAPKTAACNADTEPRQPDRSNVWYGIHIVDIANPSVPEVVGSIKTGSIHNLTLVPSGTPGHVLLYVSIPGAVQQEIYDVNLADPTKSEKATFNVERDGSDGCHDIAVFLPRSLLACNALDSGTILYDVANPTSPQFMGATDTDRAPLRRDHSSAFSWDGNTLAITDENSAGLGQENCTDRDALTQGRVRFYDVSIPKKPKYLGQAFPEPHHTGFGWCYPKQINVIPLVDGRDVASVSWASGGTTLIDFTPPPGSSGAAFEPRTIAAFNGDADADPRTSDHASFTWASFWYNGHVYANNMSPQDAWYCGFGTTCAGPEPTVGRLQDEKHAGPYRRGLDVLAPDKALRLASAVRLPRFNFATQECVPQVTSC